MSHPNRCLPVILALTLGLAACRSAAPTPTPGAAPDSTSPQPSPTAISFPATWTPAAAATPVPLPEASPTVRATASESPPEETPPTPDPALTDQAEFVADVTVPDGSDYAPGAAFTKTWRVKNTGTSTWTPEYALVFVSGERMGGPESVPLADSVAPGQSVDLSVDLTAPDRLGSYTGFWQLRSAAGALFGIGPEANQPVFVQIDVTADANTTPEPTVAAGNLRVTAASVSVDQAAVTGACPHTFNFSGRITSEGAGTMTYQLEASADTPGFQFELPAPLNSTFTSAGPRTFAVTYSLEIRNSVSGQVWLNVLSPNSLASEKLSFSLTCQP